MAMNFNIKLYFKLTNSIIFSEICIDRDSCYIIILYLQVKLSYIEIYNENIRDLLNPSAGPLELRDEGGSGPPVVAGLSEVRNKYLFKTFLQPIYVTFVFMQVCQNQFVLKFKNTKINLTLYVWTKSYFIKNWP